MNALKRCEKLIFIFFVLVIVQLEIKLFAQDEANLSDSTFYALVWSDEFSENGAIDTSKWFHQTELPNGDSWYNGEIQHYTNSINNSFAAIGKLHIVARNETYTDQGVTKDYTSARLNSKFAFTYGRVEIKAQLPSGSGTWPAIWMLGKNINEDGAYWDNEGYGTSYWPACGEIDIMEHWGANQNFVQSAIHTPSSFGATENHGGQFINTASNEFHVYSLEWTEENMEFAVDGVLHYTYEPEIQDENTWPFDEAQYLLLNIAIQPNISPNFTNSSMLIDYVRVYQLVTVDVSEFELANSIKTYPNPFTDQLIIDLDQIQQDESIELQMVALDGRFVFRKEYNISNKQLRINDLDDLASGVYILSLKLKDGIQYIQVLKN